MNEPPPHASSHWSRPASTVTGRWANKGDNRRQEPLQGGGRDKLISIGNCCLTKKGKKHKERLRMLEGGHVWWGKYAVQTFFFLPPPQVSKTISGNPWNEIWVVADRGMAVVSQCWSLAVLSLLDDKNTLAACARFCRFIICPDSLLAWCTEHFCARTQHRMCAQTSNANTTRPRPLVVQGHINPLDFCRQSRALTTYMGLWLWSVQTDYQLWFLWEMAFHRIGTKKSPTTST